MGNEAGYYFTQFVSAFLFLEKLDVKNLKIDHSEFKKYVREKVFFFSFKLMKFMKRIKQKENMNHKAMKKKERKREKKTENNKRKAFNFTFLQ